MYLCNINQIPKKSLCWDAVRKLLLILREGNPSTPMFAKRCSLSLYNPFFAFQGISDIT